MSPFTIEDPISISKSTTSTLAYTKSRLKQLLVAFYPSLTSTMHDNLVKEIVPFPLKTDTFQSKATLATGRVDSAPTTLMELVAGSLVMANLVISTSTFTIVIAERVALPIPGRETT
jgi:hypothetical protein